MKSTPSNLRSASRTLGPILLTVMEPATRILCVVLTSHINCSIGRKSLNTSDPDINEYRKDNDISTTVVNIFAFVLFEANVSNELYKWIATEGQEYDYGAFRVFIDSENPKKCNVQYQYRLAGDHLDPGELKGALAAVAFTADNEDDELQKMFGGQKFSDL